MVRGLRCTASNMTLKFLRVKFILASYEFVSVMHRRILERVFGVPVFNLYGSTETGHLLMENEAGEMKPSHDTAFLEIVNPHSRNVGELVVTTLTNDYMPLLRYRIGDLAQRHEAAYGSHFTVHGRARDALMAGDGQRVTTWQVDQCFTEVNGIMHYELRQNENGDCIFRFVPDKWRGKDYERRDFKTRMRNFQPVKPRRCRSSSCGGFGDSGSPAGPARTFRRKTLSAANEFSLANGSDHCAHANAGAQHETVDGPRSVAGHFFGGGIRGEGFSGIVCARLTRHGIRPGFELRQHRRARALGMSWEELTRTPSRLTTEAPNREERARLLAMVVTRGFIDDYSGVRISKSGRRFKISRATVWNLLAQDGRPGGQAAMFGEWEFL